jgi:hypothetical protein
MQFHCVSNVLVFTLPGDFASTYECLSDTINVVNNQQPSFQVVHAPGVETRGNLYLMQFRL